MRPIRHAFARHVCVLALLGLAALPAAAGAEILDIQAEREGDRISVLFVFDSQPADASITVSGTEAQATIAGAHGSGRLLRPNANGLRQISIADRPLGLSIGAVAQRPILSGEAQVFQNAVLFHMTLTPDTAEAAAAAPAGSLAPPPSEAAASEPAAPPAPEQFAAFIPSEPPAPEPAPESAPEPETPEGPTVEDSAAALAAALEAAAQEADALEDDAAAELHPEPETALAEAGEDPAPEADAEAAPPGPEWAQGDALWPEPAPLGPSEPGAASELLAAQLDSTACDAAAATVSADPWALDALYNHGACLARDGHRARAREVFERLQSFDPASARTMVALGVLRQDEGDRAGAQDYYEQAMATAPDDGLAVLIRLLRAL